MNPKNRKKKQISILVEISPGELFDKITILEIKKEKITDHRKLENINYELQKLKETRDGFISTDHEIESLVSKLKKCNSRLWNVLCESAVLENNSDYGKRYLELAKLVVKKNYERYELKRAINNLLESKIIEEKDYPI